MRNGVRHVIAGVILSLPAVACGSSGQPRPTVTAGAPSGGGTAGTPSMSSGGDTAMAGGAGAAGLGGASAGAAGSTSGSSGSAGSAGSGEITTNADAFTVTSQLASAVKASAPGTVGIVTWSSTLQGIAQAYVEFGLDTTYGRKAPVDVGAAELRTLLLGMKPSKTYHFRVVASNAAGSYASMDYALDTGPATDLVQIGDFTIHDAAARQAGFILLSYWQGDGSNIPFIIDADGEIVWWYDSSMMGGIARARMSADAKNMWLISASNNGSSLQRVSMDTLDEQTYVDATGSHDIAAVTGSLMAYIEYGESDCNSIFTIDPAGATSEVFESSDVVSDGMCHGNALRYSQKEDVFTFSDLSQDVFVVSRAGDVLWRLSEKVSGGNTAWGGAQHGHQLLDTSILIFANRGVSSEASRVYEYSLDGQELLSYDGGQFSANLGDVQRLPNGNTLVTYSNDSVVHEIDAQKNVVLEFDGAGLRIGYALWVEDLYEPAADTGQ